MPAYGRQGPVADSPLAQLNPEYPSSHKSRCRDPVDTAQFDGGLSQGLIAKLPSIVILFSAPGSYYVTTFRNPVMTRLLRFGTHPRGPFMTIGCIHCGWWLRSGTVISLMGGHYR